MILVQDVLGGNLATVAFSFLSVPQGDLMVEKGQQRSSGELGRLTKTLLV